MTTNALIEELCRRAFADGQRIMCQALRDAVNKAQEFGQLPKEVAAMLRGLTDAMEASATGPGIVTFAPPKEAS